MMAATSPENAAPKARFLILPWSKFHLLPRVALWEAGAPAHVDIALLGIDGPEIEVLRHRSQPVDGLRALVHGHFVVDEVEHLANRWNVDTGASFPGRDRLTLLHVNARRIRARTFAVNEAS